MRRGYLVSDFDLFGVEDLELIYSAKSRCDELILLILSDADVLRFCDRKAVFPLGERMAIAASIDGVDGVRIFTKRDLGLGEQLFISTRLNTAKIPGQFVHSATKSTSALLNKVLQSTTTPAADEPRQLARIGYVPGAWDVFHVGHLNLLLKARALCETLVVGAVTDAALATMKGITTAIPLAERMKVLESIDFIDRVVVDSSRDKREVWHDVHFDLIFKGDDWQNTPKGEQLEAEMAQIGVEVCYLPYTSHISSTFLRRTLIRVAPAADSDQQQRVAL